MYEWIDLIARYARALIDAALSELNFRERGEGRGGRSNQEIEV